MEEKTPTPTKQENPLLNMAFNIVIPVMVLNKLSDKLGEQSPTKALLLALAFPIAYGAYDYIKRKKKNWLSVFGIVNVLFTGGLALMKLEGIWFAVKEAAFPFIIGTAVLITAYTKKPFVEMFIFNENLLKTELIHQKLKERKNQIGFQKLLKNSTLLFSSSFFISSLLNYILAVRIFRKIDPKLSPEQFTTALNAQIAEMTWLSFVVIALPLTIFTMAIFYYILKELKKLTSLELTDLMRAQ